MATHERPLPSRTQDHRETPQQSFDLADPCTHEVPFPVTGSGTPPVVVLVTSNGTGMGHLTRQLTVALGLGERARAHIFSLSLAAPVVSAHGLPGEYCPSYDRGWIPRDRWNAYLRDRLVAFCREVRADAVLFDGVAPYPGLLMAKSALPGIPFAWCRRGMWKPQTNLKALRTADAFDLIIEPGDLAAAADHGPTSKRHDAVRVPPVTLLEVIDRLSRAEAAQALGLDPHKPTALVTLGSGRLGDPSAAAAIVVRELLADPQWQVVVTRAGIATQSLNLGDAQRVIEVRDVYPLARYLNAVDIAVSAGGYNAVHEFLPAAIPTLIVPSPATGTDDQVARAIECARLGLSLWAHPDDENAVLKQTRALLTHEVRERLTVACRAEQEMRPAAGGSAVGQELLALVQRGTRSPQHVPQRAPRRKTSRRLRRIVLAILGERGSNLVRRLLGRPVIRSPKIVHAVSPELNLQVTQGEPLEVVVVTDAAQIQTVNTDGRTALAFTCNVDSSLVRCGTPVEHVMAGTSYQYAMERQRIVHRYFRVVAP
jgi:hypothetical protein